MPENEGKSQFEIAMEKLDEVESLGGDMVADLVKATRELLKALEDFKALSFEVSVANRYMDSLGVDETGWSLAGRVELAIHRFGRMDPDEAYKKLRDTWPGTDVPDEYPWPKD